MIVKSPLSFAVGRKARFASGMCAIALLGVPALATVGSAMRGTGSSSSFEYQLDDREVNARYDAFVPVMHATEWVARNSNGLTPEKTREYAELWATASETGKIKSLPVTHFAQSVFEGVSGQVARTEGVIASRLERAMSREADEGNFAQAARDAMLTLRLSKALRYSDFSLQTLVSVKIEKALDTLLYVGPKLPERQQKEILAFLPKVRSNGGQLADLCRDTYGCYIDEYLSSGGSFEQRDRCPDLEAIRSAGTGKEIATVLKKTQEDMNGLQEVRPDRPFETMMSHVLDHEIKIEKRITETEQALS